MTNGASQALYIIVAVIIFGIFVSIAYSLFGNQMKNSIKTVFDDSTELANEEMTPFSPKISSDIIEHIGSFRYKNPMTAYTNVYATLDYDEETKINYITYKVKFSNPDDHWSWGLYVITNSNTVINISSYKSVNDVEITDKNNKIVFDGYFQTRIESILYTDNQKTYILKDKKNRETKIVFRLDARRDY